MQKKLPKSYETPVFLFHQGSNAKTHDFLGAHRCDDGRVVFRTWAPHAESVSVVGDFNGWDAQKNPMKKITDGGIWEGFAD